MDSMDDTNTTFGNGTYPYPNVTFNIFGYNPNKALEIAVLCLFVLCTLLVLIQNIWKKTHFMTALVVGGIMEAIAFGAMIFTTHHMDNINTEIYGYVVYLVCVLVAPTVLAAADYSIAGPLMTRGKVRVACFTPRVTKYLFLCCDIAAFFTQTIGAVIVGSAKTNISAIKSGSNIVLIGLGISLAVFVVFGLFSIILHRRILKILRKNNEDTKWTRIFFVVYFNMLLLAVRAFYRVDEFHDNLATPPNRSLSTEAYFYGFDSFLMVLLMLSWVVFHPYRFGMHNWKEEGSSPAYSSDSVQLKVLEKN